MKEIKIKGFETTLTFEEGAVNVLEVHDKKLFSQVVYNFIKSERTKAYGEEYLLIKDNKVMDMYQNILVIQDFYQVDFNNPKILKKIYEQLQRDYDQEFDEKDKLEHWKGLLIITKDLLMEYPFEFEMKDEVYFMEWLKFVGVKFNREHYDCPLINLTTLFEVNATLNLFEIIILVNVKSYFESEELSEIYKLALYNQSSLLLIEHYPDQLKRVYEKKLIIDCDFDEQVIK